MTNDCSDEPWLISLAVALPPYIQLINKCFSSVPLTRNCLNVGNSNLSSIPTSTQPTPVDCCVSVQTLQVVAASSLEYCRCSMSQLVQLGAPSVLVKANLPFSQVWQFNAPLVELHPIGQDWQSVEGGIVPYRPLAHCITGSLGFPVAKKPSAILTEEDPPMPTTVPVSGSEHSVDLGSLAYLEALHFVHAEALVSALKKPGKQSKQSENPVLSLYWPMLHFAQML